MSKALATFAVGPAATMLQHTLPAMALYARRHGYTLCRDDVTDLEPASWGKVPLLLRLLEQFDSVLWLDADVLVIDRSDDLAASVPDWAATAVVAHVTGEGRIPNTGVWYVNRRAVPLLERMMELYPTYKDAKWWEQSAFIDCLPGGWESLTAFLDPGWNRHRHDMQPTERIRFVHFTAVPDRIRRAAELAEFVR